MFKLITQLQKMKTPDKINGVGEESGDLSSQGLKFKSDGLQNSNNTRQPMRYVIIHLEKKLYQKP